MYSYRTVGHHDQLPRSEQVITQLPKQIVGRCVMQLRKSFKSLWCVRKKVEGVAAAIEVNRVFSAD